VACRALAGADGHGLSTLVLAKQLGITHPTASRWLRNLCDRGILAWLGNKPVRGAEAKAYVAKAVGLLHAIEQYAGTTGRCSSATHAGNAGLHATVRRMAAAHGMGYAFRQKATMAGACMGHSFEDVCAAILAVDASYFTVKRERMRELKSHFKGAQRKRA
jgi:transposase